MHASDVLQRVPVFPLHEASNRKASMKAKNVCSASGTCAFDAASGHDASPDGAHSLSRVRNYFYDVQYTLSHLAHTLHVLLPLPLMLLLKPLSGGGGAVRRCRALLPGAVHLLQRAVVRVESSKVL